MRWSVGLLLLGAALVVAAGLYAIEIPFHKYSRWISGKGSDRYFEIKGYKELYLSPSKLEEIPDYKEDYVQLWKEFQVRNSSIPLPTRHPMFLSVPVIEMNGSNPVPHIGIGLQDPTGREVTRIYTLPNTLYKDQSQGQELFRLPYVRSKILKKSVDELWTDIFTYQIKVEDKAIDDMLYDLYILHIRSKILPKETIRYGLIKNGRQAMVELTSEDKDYIVELVMTQESGSIFSYILKTEKSHLESMRLRAKFLHSITFAPVDESISRFLYTEFKQLNYARQIDQEGMLYLFAAWSQTPDNVDLLKEMIQFLERGTGTAKQLKPLYAYAYKKYKKTFTHRKSFDDLDDPDLVLQRKIEMEQKELKEAAESDSAKVESEPDLTPDEKINLYLKKAKDDKTKKSDEMKIH